MKIIELNTPTEQAISTICDIALKNNELGGLKIFHTVQSLIKSIQEMPDKNEEKTEGMEKSKV